MCAARGLIVTLSVLLLSTAPRAQAEEVPVFVMDIPPMATKSGSHGVVGEIVLEAMKRARLTPRLVFMPKNRAIVTMQLPGTRDHLILPLARLPEREGQFTWIAQLYHAERGFFTTGAPIRSYAQARSALRTIAVARGTANLTLLRDQGFKPEQILEISLNDDVPRMLLAGRIQAWFGPIEEMEIYLRDEPRRNQIVAGPALATTDNYLACSKQCSPALVVKLVAEISKMEQDGTIKAIRHKYASAAHEGWP
ncbi:MAG TPA: transporter substrate-binding domain-containing protein [Telluria sp.]